MNILNPRFKYRNSQNTSVADTFRKFGFKPVTEAERKARQEKLHEPPANVTQLKRKAK
jgi:hypothetical protein